MTARKIMLLGEIGVGKSSIVQRLVFDRFNFEYKPTIGVDIYRYEIPDRPGRPAVSLIVWDTDGNFGDSIFKHIYIKEAAGAVIVGDVSRPQTLETLSGLAEGFRDAMPGRPMALVANKCDLLASGNVVEVPPRVQRSAAPFYRTSAMTGSNVKHVFDELAGVIERRNA